MSAIFSSQRKSSDGHDSCPDHLDGKELFSLFVRKTGKNLFLLGLLAFILLLRGPAKAAGPFTEGSVYEPYYRVHKDSSDLVAWATGWADYAPGPGLDATWKTPDLTLGKAAADAYDVASLGPGGSITLTFARPIRNGEGWDFAVFENGLVSGESYFLELAYVEVSTNGLDFVRFDNVSLTPSPVGTYGTLDYTLIHNLAGKYPQPYGTPFDLADLAHKIEVQTGVVDLERVFYVRVVDIVGDGSCSESRPPGWGDNRPVYDPFPTFGSAGFDLDAVGVRHEGASETIRGDINGDGLLDELDVALALQVLAGTAPSGIRPDYATSGVDVNGDGRVGMEEVLYILRRTSP